MWHEYFKALWLKERDQNLRFFHMKAPHRHRKNTIAKLKDDTGEWREEEEMHIVNTKHFNEIYAAPTQSGQTDFLDSLTGKISEETNLDLSGDFTPKEVQEALQKMHPSKASSPNDMSLIFP